MNRSTFLQRLLASVVLGKMPISETKHFRKIYLLQFFVAGFRHYEGMHNLDKMQEGDLLELKREPNNEYDDCAIALYYQQKKIGFIPATVNEMLSYLLDADALSLVGVITHVEKNAQPWENVAVAIYFIQEAKKDLPAHAHYLTRIEAPHYRTLQIKNTSNKNKPLLSLDDLFATTDRVINLETIPAHHQNAKENLEKIFNNKRININGNTNYVQVATDDIYTHLYDIEEEIKTVVDNKGNKFLEFSLR